MGRSEPANYSNDFGGHGNPGEDESGSMVVYEGNRQDFASGTEDHKAHNSCRQDERCERHSRKRHTHRYRGQEAHHDKRDNPANGAVARGDEGEMNRGRRGRISDRNSDARRDTIQMNGNKDREAASTNNNPAGAIGAASTGFVVSLATNRGLIFQPISEYDPKQYVRGQLPGYAGRNSEAAIFTMIDRAITPDNNPQVIHIDDFWNSSAANDQGANDPSSMPPKVKFSDGIGHQITPTDAKVFPITAGTPDFGALFKTGPIMIESARSLCQANGTCYPVADGSQTWMLATGFTADGKGIVANDPVTGRQVILGYDPESRTIGLVTSLYDPKTSSWIAVASADPIKLASESDVQATSVSSLQAFVPVGYLAVAIR